MGISSRNGLHPHVADALRNSVSPREDRPMMEAFMKSPVASDFVVEVRSAYVDLFFKPSTSYIGFGRTSPGTLSPPSVRHAETGDTGSYIESDVLEMARSLATKALSV
jgi:hypothetical protein